MPGVETLAFRWLYHTSRPVLLPCQLVGQEAEVGMLDTLRTLFTHETSSWGSKKMCSTTSPVWAGSDALAVGEGRFRCGLRPSPPQGQAPFPKGSNSHAARGLGQSLVGRQRVGSGRLGE